MQYSLTVRNSWRKYRTLCIDAAAESFDPRLEKKKKCITNVTQVRVFFETEWKFLAQRNGLNAIKAPKRFEREEARR